MDDVSAEVQNALQALLDEGALEGVVMTPAACRGVMADYEATVNELADVVLGSPKTVLQGGGRNDDGLMHEMHEIRKTLQNGGIKIKLPVAVWVALITTCGSLIVGAFGFFHP